MNNMYDPSPYQGMPSSPLSYGPFLPEADTNIEGVSPTQQTIKGEGSYDYEPLPPVDFKTSQEASRFFNFSAIASNLRVRVQNLTTFLEGKVKSFANTLLDQKDVILRYVGIATRILNQSDRNRAQNEFFDSLPTQPESAEYSPIKSPGAWISAEPTDQSFKTPQEEEKEHVTTFGQNSSDSTLIDKQSNSKKPSSNWTAATPSSFTKEGESVQDSSYSNSHSEPSSFTQTSERDSPSTSTMEKPQKALEEEKKQPPHFLTESRFRELNSEVKLRYQQEQISQLVDYVQNNWESLQKLAQEAGKLVSVKIEDLQVQQIIIRKGEGTQKLESLESQDQVLYITPTGSIYAKLDDVDVGGFKSVTKTLLLAAPKLKSFENEIRILSETINSPSQSVAPNVQGDAKAKEIQNELSIHYFLKKKLKELKDLSPELAKRYFSHICMSKKVSETESNKAAMISSFRNGGSLAGQVKKLTDPQVKAEICCDMAMGVLQLHGLNIIHRDLNLGNFLVTLNDQGGVEKVEVSDFGTSALIQPDKDIFEAANYHIAYSPPEFYTNREVNNFKGDVYQLAVAYYQIFQGYTNREMTNLMTNQLRGKAQLEKEKNPKINEDAQFFKLLVERKSHPETWPGFNDIPEPIQGLLKEMLNVDPSKRPSMDVVVQRINDYTELLKPTLSLGPL